MATAKSTPAEEPTEESAYAKDAEEVKAGKPVGPEHDASFHAPDFYDPKTGKRVETPWDSEQQKQDPGYDPDVMAGTIEQPATPSGGEGGETTPSSSSSSTPSKSSSTVQ